MKNLIKRHLNLFGFLFCSGIFAFSLYLQIAKHLEPCPLCIIQRFLILILGIWFLGGTLPFTKIFLRKLHAAVTILFSAMGVIVAARQVWLQHLPPDQVPACGPALSFLLENLPFNQAMYTVFSGSGECAKVEWTLLHLSIAQWSLLTFVFFGILGIINFFRTA